MSRYRHKQAQILRKNLVSR